MDKETQHIVYFQNSNTMKKLLNESVHLVVTSPPYPMIEMWDNVWQSNDISEYLESGNSKVFEKMHSILDEVWKECYRVLIPGGYMCINIGDATRKFNNEFQVFSNHSRITKFCTENLNMLMLPSIIWNKPTNSPTKFLGSGVLPCGAYVTLEHEYILIFKKRGKRVFESEEEKLLRRQSSCFFEERNVWFSDIWRINGVEQKINKSKSRERNASYPLEIPFRLINMYSCIGDIVLDPFCGLGTTSLAAMLSGRNSINFEIDDNLKSHIKDNVLDFYSIDDFNKITHERYNRHLSFMRERKDNGKDVIKHYNHNIRCSVVSGLETDILLRYIKKIFIIDENDKELHFSCEYNFIKNIEETPNENALF